MKIGETARIIDVSTATIRNYVKAFEPYFSETAKRKHGKNFTNQDIQTLRTIRQHLDNGLTYEETAEYLTFTPEIIHGQEDPTFFESAAVANENAITLPQVADFVQQAIDNAAAQHQREIDALNRLIEKLETDLENARKPWWKRLL